MQVGAGGELTWDTVALPFGVVSKPTTWMETEVNWLRRPRVLSAWCFACTTPRHRYSTVLGSRP
jgi:hypothetical protein